MGVPISQIPSIILPQAWLSEASVEPVNDALEHTSLEVDIRHLQEKQVHIQATEVVAVGAPGNLLCWVELSPYSTLQAAALGIAGTIWAAIGGGGGALPPVAPLVEVGTGVNGTVHTIIIPWAIHSKFCRVIVQTPAIAAGESWNVQVRLEGKGP